MERKSVRDILSQSLRDRVLTGPIWITGNEQEPEKEATRSSPAVKVGHLSAVTEAQMSPCCPAASAALWACPVCVLHLLSLTITSVLMVWSCKLSGLTRRPFCLCLQIKCSLPRAPSGRIFSRSITLLSTFNPSLLKAVSCPVSPRRRKYTSLN